MTPPSPFDLIGLFLGLLPLLIVLYVVVILRKTHRNTVAILERLQVSRPIAAHKDNP